MSYKVTIIGRVCGALLNCRAATWLRSAPARNALFVLFIAGILAYGAGFAWYMLVTFDHINIIRAVNIDDAFYYFQIAYHLAEGKYSTFDGGITRTNGYHPLWIFAITPFYWIFDKETALFGIKAFEIMLIAGGIAGIAGAARLARLPWVLLFPALPLLYYNRAMLIGTEAAAALFMLGLFFLALMLYARNPARWTWPLAVVAFALPWVRLEYVAISVAATVALCIIEWSWRERPAGASWRGLMLSAPSQPLVLISGAVAGILVYFLYNGLVFGGIVPVSGATKAVWSQILFFEDSGGYSLAQNFRDILQIPVFDLELLVALTVCAGVPLVWWLARRSRDERDWLLLVFLVGVFGLAAGHLAKFAQTVLTVHPAYGGYIWYFVPAYLMMALLVPVSCYVASYLIRRCIGPRWRRTANLLSVGIVVAGAVFLLARTDFTVPFRYVEGWNETSLFHTWHFNSYMGTLVLNRVLPDDSIIGVWDAGTVGYFSRFPVVNLDGLVNSYDYLRATKGHSGPIGELKPVYREFGITHLVNRTKRIFDHKLYENRVFLEHMIPGMKFKLGATEPLEDATAADWLWQQLEPHFAGQSDGVGLILDGRLAQAFAKDCIPDALAVWSWADLERATVAKSVSILHRNQSGLCVAAAVLPQNAGHPVQVAAMAASDYLAGLTGDSAPVIRSQFDVHLVENRLIYVKEQCGPNDLDAAFFLHLYPVDVNDLSIQRRLYGFDNRDFHEYSFIKSANTCWAEVPLPEYDIAEIRTGQFIPADGGFKYVWQGQFLVAPGPAGAPQ